MAELYRLSLKRQQKTWNPNCQRFRKVHHIWNQGGIDKNSVRSRRKPGRSCHYDPRYGARPLKRVIQRMLQDPLAMRILEGDFVEGSKISVDVCSSGDALEFR